MIEGAKGARFPDLQITLLSTMWGLRKTEIATVLSAGLDGKTLEVQTAKHGRQRVHPIPPQLSLPLSFRGKHETANAMGPAFQRIMRRYVREPEPREGWHAIRRSLVTELFHNGAPEIIIFKFMGWRRNDMTYTYFKPSATEIMDAILPKHPFFPLWLS